MTRQLDVLMGSWICDLGRHREKRSLKIGIQNASLSDSSLEVSAAIPISLVLANNLYRRSQSGYTPHNRDSSAPPAPERY